jgi:hypothetical protein
MEIPSEGTVGNSNGRLRAISGRQPRGKVTILRKKFSPPARPYLPSFFGWGDDPFGSLSREVQTFEDFSQRTPLQMRALSGGHSRNFSPVPPARFYLSCSPGAPTADAIPFNRLLSSAIMC